MFKRTEPSNAGPRVEQRVDLSGALVALEGRSRLTDRILDVVAWPGYAPQSLVIPPLLAAFVAWRRGAGAGFRQALAWGVAPLGAGIKRLVRRPRPPMAWLRLPGSRRTGPSFPSTHVATYTSVYGSAASSLRRTDPAIAAACVALVLAIGPSRVRDGDHWATDVVAGYLLGAASLGIVALLGRRESGRPSGS